MTRLVEENIRFSYPGAVLTPTFGALAHAANANKQPPSASGVWLGARTPILATLTCGVHLTSDGVYTTSWKVRFNE